MVSTRVTKVIHLVPRGPRLVLRSQGQQGRQETVVPVSVVPQHLLAVRAVIFLLLLTGLLTGELQLIIIQLLEILARLPLTVALALLGVRLLSRSDIRSGLQSSDLLPVPMRTSSTGKSAKSPASWDT